MGSAASDELLAEVEQALSGVSAQVLADRIAQISRIDDAGLLDGLEVPTVTISARGDRLVNGGAAARARGGMHFEIDGPHLLLQTRPVEVASVLGAS